MKKNTWITKTPPCLMAVVLLAVGATTSALAAVPALQSLVTLRPLTPTELVTYSVPNLQVSAGLDTIGVGEPAYLEALVNAAIAPSNIVSVTWTLTGKPLGSAAALAVSPLGTNIPTYKMADRYNQANAPYDQVAWPGGLNTGSGTNNGRVLLRPDVTGQYTVTATIVTVGSGTTNLTQNITAGTYLGVETCELCHSGGVIAQDEYHPWSQTPHATFFSTAIDGLQSSHYSKSCISCHTVGYDTNTNAVNGGFDDVASQLGWSFPAVLSPTNWAYMQSAYPALANLANIQCENCHGPGSEHAASLGNTNISNWPRLEVTYIAADCSQCHDDTPNHIKSAEWNNSLHARTTRTPSGSASRIVCVRCHTAPGFQEYADNFGSTNVYTTNVVYEAITCQACHDPHNYNNPYQLRLGTNFANVVLSDGTSVTNAGVGAFCMNCHHIRNGSAASNVANYQQGILTWPGGSSFGTHDGPQGEMLEGVGAITYGQTLPSSAHRYALTNTCVDCHMQTVASTDPAFLQAGGHTMEMSYNVVTNGVTNKVDQVAVCIQCHGPSLTSFNFPVQDYDGDGIIEGVQTEVQNLLNKLSTLLPPSGYQANVANYVADGLVKSPSSQTNWPAKFLNAAYNWQFVNNDGSYGIHNAPFAVGLLKASIADLTGDANNDGLPDAWQIDYFGSITNPLAAPNASPAGDGIPNWLKYSLGLDPMIPGITLPDGVVWANTSSIGGATNTIHIYTAAEVAFDTQVGTTYQLQGISTLGGGWQNVGTNIAGTGSTISYLTPTRSNTQQFYRVVHTP